MFALLRGVSGGLCSVNMVFPSPSILYSKAKGSVHSLSC